MIYKRGLNGSKALDSSQEMKKKTTKKTNRMFGSNAIAYFEGSSITGISSIVNSRGCRQTFVKTIILVACVGGFLYQTYNFLKMYRQYSTLAMEQPLISIYKPAITICDENLIRRNYYCEEKYNLCWNASRVEVAFNTTFCQAFMAYCYGERNEYRRIPEYFVVKYAEEHFDLNFTKASGFSIDKNLISCQWRYTDAAKENSGGMKTMDCGEPKFIRGMNKEKYPGACYTLSTEIEGGEYGGKGQPLKFAMAQIVLKWNASELNNLKPDLLSQSKDYGDLSKSYRAYYLSFHSPGTISNPFRDGIRVEERRIYRIQLHQKSYARSPSPYSTHCFDYWAAWRKNGRKGPLNREQCQEQCKISASIEAYGCVAREVNYPHEPPWCFPVQQFDLNVLSKIEDCAANCKDACYENKYIAEPEIIGQLYNIIELGNSYGAVSVVKIHVDVNVLKSVDTVYVPKYESVELFSYIGGYLGMWLGWSLVAIFDFLEILISYISHSLSEKKRKASIVKPFRIKY